MRHGTVRIKLLITGKSTLRKRAPPTHSVAAITLGCPCSSPRFPPLPGQPVSRPARPPAAAARTPCDFLCAPRPPVRPLAQRPPERLTAACTPRSRPHAPQPLARSAAAARAPRRGRRPHAPLPRARPAVARTPRGRPCAPRLPARFAAAFAPRGFDSPHASRARLPPARRRRTRFDCLPCKQTMTVGSDCPHSLRPPLEGLLPALPPTG